MDAGVDGHRVRRRPPPLLISENLSDEDLGQALLSAVDSRSSGPPVDWGFLVSPRMYSRARDVLTTMKNTNLAAIDRRKLELDVLKTRLQTPGETDHEEYVQASREFDQWHIRAKSFTRHVDHALQSLRDARDASGITDREGGDLPQLALRLAAAVDDLIASVGDDELTPEESRAVVISSELRCYLRRT